MEIIEAGMSFCLVLKWTGEYSDTNDLTLQRTEFKVMDKRLTS